MRGGEVADAELADFGRGEEGGHGLPGLVLGKGGEGRGLDCGWWGVTFGGGGGGRDWEWERERKRKTYVQVIDFIPPRRGRHGPMHEVEIQIIKPQIFQRLIECLFHHIRRVTDLSHPSISAKP